MENELRKGEEEMENEARRRGRWSGGMRRGEGVGE